jgi:hypothetical protein
MVQRKRSLWWDLCLFNDTLEKRNYV